MNEHRDDRSWCCFHPKVVVVGVCALCLNEKLLVLASQQAHLQHTHTNYCLTPKRVLPKIFSLTNLLHRSDVKHQKSEVYDSSSTSQDSFISIKFEDNGVASWDKGKISRMSHDQKFEMSWDESWDNAKKIKTVIEHAKPRDALTWRKRIGHLVQLIKMKRSSKGNVCHVGTKLKEQRFKIGG